MRQRLPSISALLLVLVIGLLSTAAWAGTSGKISGVVLDAATSEPIVGATVRVLGTTLATETDLDGEFFILDVPSGKYSVGVTFVGFEPITKKEVRVLTDLTTPVDFDVEPATVQLGDELVVYAVNPVIQKDLTESKIIFTSDRIKTLPNIITVQAVLSNYPGVVIDRNNGLHVRGGRTGQVSYYFDGFSVQDPFVSTAGIRVIPGALEELSLSSGGFLAEYGDALSGIVNAVTRKGGSEYHGGVRLYEGYGHRYDVHSASWGKLGRLGNRSGVFRLSGPLPGLDPSRYTFSTAAEYLNSPTSLPHNSTISHAGTARISAQPSSSIKLKANFTFSKAAGEIYNHRDNNGVSYDFNLDGLGDYQKRAYLAGVTGSYMPSEKLIVSASISRFFTSTKRAPRHLFWTYWKDWPGYSEDADGNYNGTIHENNYLNSPDYTDEAQFVGFTDGDDYLPLYGFRKTTYTSLAANQTYQLTKVHQLKSGFEYRKYSVSWDSKQFFNLNPYGEKYTSRPVNTSAYIQDKMEYKEYIINVGLRYDYRNADISYIAYTVTPDELVALNKEASPKSRISPRLGVSFPISEKTVMHFNYGVNFQTPRFDHIYLNLQGDVSSGLPLLGNPDLVPEQTTTYELGLDHLIGDDLRIDVTAFHKNIDDLVTTRPVFFSGGQPVTQFTNDDYGSVKGFDLSIEKLPGSSPVSGSISYSYMLAFGNGSSAREPYYSYITSNTDTLPPVKEYPLDFDQRHNLTAVVSYQAASDWKVDLLGIPVPGDWGLSFVGRYGSGMPYTVTDVMGNRLGERNEARLPSSSTVDMRFFKNIRMPNSAYVFSFFVEVDNLFNKRNIIDVYSRTGQPDDDGNAIVGASLALSQEQLDYYDRLYDHNPQNFSPPRTVRVGLELNF